MADTGDRRRTRPVAQLLATAHEAKAAQGEDGDDAAVRLLPEAAGLLDVAGFRASGVHAGIKKTRRDVALIVSDRPCAAAAVYTQNKVQAAPIAVTKHHLADGTARAVVINSGVANACTGQEGMTDATEMARMAGAALGVDADDVVVASTGVIGKRLPMAKLASGIQDAAQALDGAGPLDAAEAIMTTDTVPKQVLVEVRTPDGPVRIGGIAKGSGMIHPNMATMLAFLATDADVAPADLQALLTAATDETFNMITVDGDTSTNDMVVALANGASGVRLAPGTPGWDAFAQGLTTACRDLAVKIARDGEGARTLIEVRVTGAATEGDARAAARAVAGSNLVKAAVFGRDPNWGRIVAALGRSGADLDPARVAVTLANHVGQVRIVADGAGAAEVDARMLAEVLDQDALLVHCDLGLDGTGAEATAWGCDLSHDYVRINSAYRT